MSSALPCGMPSAMSNSHRRRRASLSDPSQMGQRAADHAGKIRPDEGDLGFAISWSPPCQSALNDPAQRQKKRQADGKTHEPGDRPDQIGSIGEGAQATSGCDESRRGGYDQQPSRRSSGMIAPHCHRKCHMWQNGIEDHGPREARQNAGNGHPREKCEGRQPEQERDCRRCEPKSDGPHPQPEQVRIGEAGQPDHLLGVVQRDSESKEQRCLTGVDRHRYSSPARCSSHSFPCISISREAARSNSKISRPVPAGYRPEGSASALAKSRTFLS
jgi:hypothetical protein